jgi:hypothetical protein
MAEVPDLRTLAADAANIVTNGHKPKGKGKTKPVGPPLPAWDADTFDMRRWLAEALSLTPPDAIESIEQAGPLPTDIVKIGVRTPMGLKIVRFDQAKDIGAPAKLRSTFALATAGRVRVRHMTIPEALDVLAAVATLAQMIEHATAADETTGWLRGYLHDGDRLLLPTTTSEDRWETLKVLRSRIAFGKPQANAWIHGDLDWGSRWAVVIDEARALWWIRYSEFACYVKNVVGFVLPRGELTMRIRELGGDHRVLDADMRRRENGGPPAGPRPRLVMFKLPAATVQS